MRLVNPKTRARAGFKTPIPVTRYYTSIDRAEGDWTGRLRANLATYYHASRDPNIVAAAVAEDADRDDRGAQKKPRDEGGEGGKY